MEDVKRDRLERERRRLVLAESDMRQVAAAASYLGQVRMNGNAERVMWTGLVVTYARPYVPSRKSGVGPVGGRLATPEDPDLRPLHDELCRRRNDLFAHTDITDFRGEVDVYAALGIGGGRFVEQWAPMDPKALPDIKRLAQEQERRFRHRLREIEEELGITSHVRTR